MKVISYREAMLRSRYTGHGRTLLEVVRRQPGIELEALVRDHDPAPPSFVEVTPENRGKFLPKNAFHRFPRGGHAVKQLCDAGALVITERLRVYLPNDLPLEDLAEPSDENASDESREARGAPPGPASPPPEPRTPAARPSAP